MQWLKEIKKNIILKPSAALHLSSNSWGNSLSYWSSPSPHFCVTASEEMWAVKIALDSQQVWWFSNRTKFSFHFIFSIGIWLVWTCPIQYNHHHDNHRKKKTFLCAAVSGSITWFPVAYKWTLDRWSVVAGLKPKYLQVCYLLQIRPIRATGTSYVSVAAGGKKVLVNHLQGSKHFISDLRANVVWHLLHFASLQNLLPPHRWAPFFSL